MKKLEIIFKQLFVLCLLIVSPGCINTEAAILVTPGPPRKIIQNDLPLAYRWSQSLTNGRPNVNHPVVCNRDTGAIITWLPDEDQWQGIAAFDEAGDVLWNQKNAQGNSITIDEQAVYMFESPKLRAYDLSSGRLLWETEEGLATRLSSYLTVEKEMLLFISDYWLNSYDRKTGDLISKEVIPTHDLVWRHKNTNLHSAGNPVKLYATSASNPTNKLWESNVLAYRTFLPQVYENSVLVQYTGMGFNICRVDLDDGHTIWCEDKQLLSNVAVHDDIGYGINNHDELIGFRLEDGVDVGKIVLRPEGTHDIKVRYHVGFCEQHLLAYMSSPEELIWFDFLPE